MKAVLRRKQDLLFQRRADAHARTRDLRLQVRDSAASPRVLLSVFLAGMLTNRLIVRRSQQPRKADGVGTSRTSRRFAILGGALLGTAVRRGLRGAARDLLSGPDGEQDDGRRPA